MTHVHSDVAISLDGFVAGPDQDLEFPLGRIGGIQARDLIHGWVFSDDGDSAAELDAIVDAGAFIMGRNMFGPGRGEWDLDWTGWWGENPPYHGPVFVLSHHPRQSVTMEGGTTFHFVTDGIESALLQAREAAGDRGISVAGGASTVNQFLAAGLLDELRLHVVPVTLGVGERLFDGVPPLRLEQVSARQANGVTHLGYRVLGFVG
ncbi:MAG TPA: dihydrofolate reductase family protein [Pseudolysinimonas sp.]|jgi:dihydrofolate reductase|nr:dihydrofolate reductase family protein [Pseudolysinimonas sp.]